MLMMKRIPNQTGSKPSATTMGTKIGAVIMMMPTVSMTMPSSSRMNIIITRTT